LSHYGLDIKLPKSLKVNLTAMGTSGLDGMLPVERDRGGLSRQFNFEVSVVGRTLNDCTHFDIIRTKEPRRSGAALLSPRIRLGYRFGAGEVLVGPGTGAPGAAGPVAVEIVLLAVVEPLSVPPMSVNPNTRAVAATIAMMPHLMDRLSRMRGRVFGLSMSSIITALL
jgi:hypothetical protein